jgi:tetratricopeptide (TPR) repeat protein/predicted Ser/Thr protein kinase
MTMRESQPAVPAGELGPSITRDGSPGLTSTASVTGRRAPGESVELVPGMHVDRFRIVARLGGGGMGVIYEAYDPELDRMLALKLLRPDTSTSRARARLLREAQAAARLAHPNVVAIYDVGAVGDQIFVAMERIAGRDLVAWRAERERSLGEIIDVFVQAGRGLAAAHAAGLVHRDVKPHNILVGDDGRVRVVDFGLARAGGRCDSSDSGDSSVDESLDDTDPDAGSPADLTATPTATPTTGGFGLLDASITIPGDVIGTPAYMAPEQHRCEPIDARADQFSFCVSLWEALTGQRPFDGDSAEEILARISRRELGPPPRVPRRLVAALRRGLAPLPGDRFPELAPLLVALERARPGRRRLALAATAVALVAAGGGIYAATTADERPPCRASLAGVWDREARDRLGRGLTAAGPGGATTAAAVAGALDRWAARWTGAREQACLAERSDQQPPMVRDRRLACLESRRRHLAALVGQLAGADASVLERAVDAAYALPEVELCAEAGLLAARFPVPDTAAMRDRVAAARGELASADATADAGRFPEAERRLEQLAREAESIHYLPLTAEVLQGLGSAQADGGKPDAGKTTLERALLVAEAAAHDAIRLEALIELMWIEGVSRERFPEALALVPHAEAMLLRLGGDELLEAKLANTRGGIAFAQGKLDEAEALYRDALERRRRAVGDRHPEVARAMVNVGNAQLRAGRYRDAQESYRGALERLEASHGREATVIAGAVFSLGHSYYYLGQLDQAGSAYRRAIALREVVMGPGHISLAGAINNLGQVRQEQGALDDALALLQRALDIKRAALGDHASVAASEHNVGVVLTRLGRFARAREWLELGRDRRLRLLGDKHGDLAESWLALGELELALARPGRARKQFARAIRVADRAALGQAHPMRASAMAALGECDLMEDMPERALERLRAALAIREGELGADHAATRAVRAAIGRGLLALGRPRDALPFLRDPDTATDPVLRVENRFALARALAADGQPGARREAGSARDAAAALGERAARQRARIQAWLKRHDRE